METGKERDRYSYTTDDDIAKKQGQMRAINAQITKELKQNSQKAW